MKSTDLQNQINDLDQLIQQGAADAQLNLWEMQRKELNDQLQVALTEEAQQQERVQAQAEMVESITLAYDYNEILGNPLANETIIENIKQYRLQDSEEHYAEVARIKEDHKTTLDMLYTNHYETTAQHIEDKNDLQRRLDAENEQAKKDAIEFAELEQQFEQCLAEKKDAEQTRDNAARLLAEANEELEKHKQASVENLDLKAQIEALKQELTAKKALTVSGNEKLAELAAKAKESTAAAAARGIERWNTQYGTDIPVLEVPEIQPVNPVMEVVETAENIPFQVQTTDSGADQTADRDTNLEQVVEQSEVTLDERVEQIEREQSMMHELLVELNAKVRILSDVSPVDVQEAIKAVA